MTETRNSKNNALASEVRKPRPIVGRKCQQQTHFTSSVKFTTTAQSMDWDDDDMTMGLPESE